MRIIVITTKGKEGMYTPKKVVKPRIPTSGSGAHLLLLMFKHHGWSLTTFDLRWSRLAVSYRQRLSDLRKLGLKIECQDGKPGGIRHNRWTVLNPDLGEQILRLVEAVEHLRKR